VIQTRNAFQGVQPRLDRVLNPSNHRVLAYGARLGEETVLIVNNLSSLGQRSELNLQMYKRHIPIEMSAETFSPALGTCRIC